MPETHTSKDTAPDDKSSEKSIIIGYPVPDSELPSAEDLGTTSEKGARLELLSKVSVGLGRLATGRQSYESGDSDRAIDRARKAFLMSRLHPDTPAYLLIENTKDGSDDDNGDGSRRATWMRVDQGDFSTTINPGSEKNHGLPPAEDALDAWKAQFPQSENQPTELPEDPRDALRAVLRAAGKLNPTKAESEPAGKEANSDGDLSVADTESESVAPENQDELGNSDEQDPNESPEVSGEQPPSASEALKALAEADDTRICIRNMSDAAESMVRTLRRTEIPLSSNNLQESASGISTALNRFSATVEKVGGDLPLDEAARLRDAVDQVRYALGAMSNVAEQGFSGRIGSEEYPRYAVRLNDSIAELQRFMNASVDRQENEKQNQ